MTPEYEEALQKARDAIADSEKLMHGFRQSLDSNPTVARAQAKMAGQDDEPEPPREPEETIC